ncbi:MAG: SDR family oxidoreductase [Rhodospirillales bacterium]|nr:SDR family oxidoreductase [Rhodospirillales bacterium]
MELFDKVVVVTEAASGIGYEAAKLLCHAGASVYITDRSVTLGRDAVEQFRAENSSLQDIKFVAMDVDDAESVARAAEEIHNDVKCIDILINSAGWEREDLTDDTAAVLSGAAPHLRCEGPVNVARAFLAPMVERGEGRIVNVACDGCLSPSPRVPDLCLGCDRVRLFTRELSGELAGQGVNVNCLCLGPEGSIEDERNAGAKGNPAANSPDPEAIREAILFFASPASGHITGQMMRLNSDRTEAA